MSEPPPAPSFMRRHGVTILLLIVVLAMGAYLLLPVAAERTILPAVFRSAGIADYRLPVRRLGLFGMDLGPLRIGPEAAPGLSVASLSAVWTPYGLVRKRISAVAVDGLIVRLELDEDGRPRIAGLPMPAGDGRDSDAESWGGLPVLPGRVEIRNAVVHFTLGGRRLRIPVDAVVRTNPDGDVLDGLVKAGVLEGEVAVNARIDLRTGRATARWNGEGIRLARASALAGFGDRFHSDGEAGLSGAGEARLSPFQPGPVSTEFRIPPCRLSAGDARLELAGKANDGLIRIELESPDTRSWRLAVSPASIRGYGLKADGQLKGALQLSEAGVAWEGRVLTDFYLRGSAGSDEEPGFSYAFDTTADVAPKGAWQAAIEGRGAEGGNGKIRLEHAEAVLEAAHPELKIVASGNGDGAEADFQWRQAKVSLLSPSVRVRMPSMQGGGSARFDGTRFTGAFSARPDRLRFDADGVSGALTRLEASGEWTAGPGVELDARLTFGDGSVLFPAADAEVRNLRGDLPLAWPPPAQGAAGSFTLGTLSWKGRDLGKVTGRLRQEQMGLSFQASHASSLISRLKASANGRIDPAARNQDPLLQLTWTADRPADAPDIDVAGLLPDPPGMPMVFRGAIRASGEAIYTRAGVAGRLEAEVDSGRLQLDDPGLVIQGLQTKVVVPDLGVIRTAPSQRLEFDTLSVGAVRIENGRIAYQIEPGPTIFLEDAAFRWCDGTVTVPATRFKPGVDEYDVTVYADRLKLTQLLEQLGVAKAEGSGALNGRIPVQYRDGRLTFHDGFLYSSPGEGGVIRVRGTEILTAGIPPGTPQYNQMELARHALKDYDYQWAKILLNTVGEDLLLKLQLDGKPAEPLPFIYDPEAGGFVRAPAGSPGSSFQGIRLDVNFQLPLNRMLRYTELLNRFQ